MSSGSHGLIIAIKGMLFVVCEESPPLFLQLGKGRRDGWAILDEPIRSLEFSIDYFIVGSVKRPIVPVQQLDLLRCTSSQKVQPTITQLAS
jgi:hypothetical protein